MSIADVSGESVSEIWNRVLGAESDQLTPEKARLALMLELDPTDLARMQELSTKQQSSDLSTREASELRNYRDVAYRLDILRAKARLTLKRHATDSGK